MASTSGSNRVLIGPEAAQRLRLAGALVEDQRLARTNWFDGRFLAARDLIREQQYFLAREADLGRAAGSGVASGLDVEAGADAFTLVIGAGHGLTPSGELVLLERRLELRLGDIPRAEQLTAKFGLGRVPAPPRRNRNGVFVLALRPVEFTANPVGGYPTSLTGQRTVEDGDVIEATAIVLIPWPDDVAAQAGDSIDRRRGRIARRIFLDSDERGLPADVLPLAMLALENNTVAWLDVPMLRRELGADRDDLPGLGLAPRALRFAHLLQHQQHMADALRDNGGRAFAAASVFPALPPAGPLPPGVIDPADFTQRYFPAEVDVDFAVIPEDELPALLEEALALPGFDLTADAETLDASAVVMLAPVPRNEWRAVQSRLQTLVRAVKPGAPNQVASRKPLEILQRLRLPRLLPVPLDPTSPADAEWQRLAALPTLWYVRRRNLAYREDATGTALRLAGRALVLDADTVRRLDTLGLRALADTTLERASPAARAEITQLLLSPRVAASPATMAAVLGDLSRTGTLDQAEAILATEKLTAPEATAGLEKLDAAGLADSKAALERIASSDWTEVDRQARTVPTATLSTMKLGVVEDSLKLTPTSKTPVTPVLVQPGRVIVPVAAPRPAAPARKAAQEPGTARKPVVAPADGPLRGTPPARKPARAKKAAKAATPARAAKKPAGAAAPATPRKRTTRKSAARRRTET